MKMIRKGSLELIVNDAGDCVTKQCNRCRQQKPLDAFAEGRGFGGKDLTYIDCMYTNPSVRMREVEYIEAQWEAGSERRFEPKYDVKGRRWLFAYENEEFRELALKSGWKSAKEEYGLNQFQLGLMKRRLFSDEEIAIIDKMPNRRRVSSKKSTTADNLVAYLAKMAPGDRVKSVRIRESIDMPCRTFSDIEKDVRVIKAMAKYGITKEKTFYVKH